MLSVITDSDTLASRQERLFDLLRGMRRVLVAFSGGTDSSYLAWAATRVLGADALAITADSPSLPASHKREAEEFVRHFGIAHEYIATREFESPDYLRNDSNRCFYCRDVAFAQMKEFAHKRGFEHIVFGVNVDDLGDYRPGLIAARQHGIVAPLADTGLDKADIRELSRAAGLPTWDRPSSACLSSRIPYGTPISIQSIKTVETGEEQIAALGFRQFRVRFHGEVARIEIAPDELPRALNLEMAGRFTAIFKALGFKYVALDLEGYRQGSLNEVLPLARGNHE